MVVKAKATPQRMAALTSFTGAVDGAIVTVRKGDEFRSTDALVKKYPTLFGPVAAPAVETATAAPGEKRGA